MRHTQGHAHGITRQSQTSGKREKGPIKNSSSKSMDTLRQTSALRNLMKRCRPDEPSQPGSHEAQGGHRGKAGRGREFLKHRFKADAVAEAQEHLAAKQ